MRLTRCLPALALLFFLPARADETAASAPPKDPTAKKAPATATAKPANQPAAKAGAPGTANMIVTRDPETGELRPPTAAEREKLLGRRPLAAPEPEVVTLPDGTRMMRLGPNQASLSVTRKNPDGTLTSACVHGPDEARVFLEAAPGPAPAPATREK